MATNKSENNWFSRHKVLTGLLVLVVLGLIIGVAGGSSSEPAAQPNTSESEQVDEAKQEEKSVPAEYTSAFNQAGTYANTMNLSKKGVYDQLVSEYGGQFSEEAAKYAVDNVKADWKKNALQKAKDYQSQQNLSPSAIRDQLISSAGEKFTEAEADYAVENLNK